MKKKELQALAEAAAKSAISYSVIFYLPLTRPTTRIDGFEQVMLPIDRLRSRDVAAVATLASETATAAFTTQGSLVPLDFSYSGGRFVPVD